MSTQRRRRQTDANDYDDERQSRRRRSENEDSEGGYGGDSDAEMDEDVVPGQSADDLLAKKLVRYAISCEFSRMAIRREGIKERVLGTQGRSFKRIFTLAQEQLRDKWGMEMRELPVREKMTLQEKRQAMKSNSQPKVGSGTYVLSSTLPAAFRTAAIITPSKTPSSEDEATYIAFYTLVVSLIWLSGGELSEQKLRRYLLRLNAGENVSTEKTETTLKKMEKQGYVIKRVDKPPIGQDGDHTITWYVGPRAKEEIGLDGVMGFAKAVFGDDADEALDRKLNASLEIKDRPNAQRLEEEGGADRSRRQTGSEE